MEGGASPSDLGEDIASAGLPDKGLGVLVVLVKIVVDDLDQGLEAGKDFRSNTAHGEVSKEAFHHVEPRGARRGEVEYETRMFYQPGFHFGVFVGGVIVEDEVERFIRRGTGIQVFEESQPFLMTVARRTASQDGSVQRIEGGKQGGRAVAFIIVRHGAAPSATQRQSWLGAFQSLNLAFLIDTKDEG